jgi:Protein of unknown function (DUF3489)
MTKKPLKAKARAAEAKQYLKKAAKKARTAPALKAASAPTQPGGCGAKKNIIQNLVSRPEGATLGEIMEATGWQAHSVRGFLSGTLKKKMGLRIYSAKSSSGARNYRIPSK